MPGQETTANANINDSLVELYKVFSKLAASEKQFLEKMKQNLNLFKLMSEQEPKLDNFYQKFHRLINYKKITLLFKADHKQRLNPETINSFAQHLIHQLQTLKKNIKKYYMAWIKLLGRRQNASLIQQTIHSNSSLLNPSQKEQLLQSLELPQQRLMAITQDINHGLQIVSDAHSFNDGSVHKVSNIVLLIAAALALALVFVGLNLSGPTGWGIMLAGVIIFFAASSYKYKLDQADTTDQENPEKHQEINRLLEDINQVLNNFKEELKTQIDAVHITDEQASISSAISFSSENESVAEENFQLPQQASNSASSISSSSSSIRRHRHHHPRHFTFTHDHSYIERASNYSASSSFSSSTSTSPARQTDTLAKNPAQFFSGQAQASPTTATHNHQTLPQTSRRPTPSPCNRS